MRIYKDFKQALGEIKRDLAEMGIRVHPQTMQGKWIADKPSYETLELQNYTYAVSQPNSKDLHPTQPWADAEFEERISQKPINPGEAWRLRPEVWEEFIESNGHFSYTYAGRLSQPDSSQLVQLVKGLKDFPDNRNHLLTIWQASDLWKIGDHRVPCSISYHFMRRNGLMLTYYQRSADLVTHLENDIYLAARLQKWVAEQLECSPGRFTHFINSLHAYRKDLEGIF